MLQTCPVKTWRWTLSQKQKFPVRQLLSSAHCRRRRPGPRLRQLRRSPAGHRIRPLKKKLPRPSASSSSARPSTPTTPKKFPQFSASSSLSTITKNSPRPSASFRFGTSFRFPVGHSLHTPSIVNILKPNIICHGNANVQFSISPNVTPQSAPQKAKSRREIGTDHDAPKIKKKRIRSSFLLFEFCGEHLFVFVDTRETGLKKALKKKFGCVVSGWNEIA